jgi:peroxiredoxin
MMPKPLAEALEEAFRHCRDMDASLSERLDSLARAVRTLSPPFADAVERLVARLQQSGAGQAAPQIGELLPPFHLPDEAGRTVSLDQLRSNGPVAVTFHRGHWCPYCRLNTIALAKAQKEIEREGSQIVAITPDRQQFAEELKTESKARFSILTDMDNGYALSLNLLIWVGAEMEQMISAAGLDIPRYQGNTSWMLPIPATFVVGTDGRVKARFVDPDYRKRMEIEGLIAALRSARLD